MGATRVAGAILLCLFTSAATADSAERLILAEWTGSGLAAFSPNADATVRPTLPDGIEIRACGRDPQITSPLIDLPARNSQWLEITMRSLSSGQAEVYWAPDSEQPWGGFRREKRVCFSIVGDGSLHCYRIYPCWGAEERIVRFRLDMPPALGAKHVLTDVRIKQATDDGDAVRWVFMGTDAEDKGALADRPGGTAISHPVQGQRYINLCMSAIRPTTVAVLGAPLDGAPIPIASLPLILPGQRCYALALPDSDTDYCIVLRGNGEANGDVKIESASLDDRPLPSASLVPALICDSGADWPCGLARTVHVRIDNWGGKAARALRAELAAKGVAVLQSERELQTDLCEPGSSWPIACRLVAKEPGAGQLNIALSWDGGAQLLEVPLYFRKTQYAMPGVVPKPRVKTDPYDIGVYYFPGWYRQEHWRPLLPFADRTPLLGFYDDNEPEIADWHIYWAGSAGIDFFIYDWYWERGQRHHEGALHLGYMQSHLKSRLKYCILWANHNRPGTHSTADLLDVTRYWIDNYFRDPDYYRLGGRPVVVVFAPGSIRKDLGGSTEVRHGFDAMRALCSEHGVAPVFLVACMGWPSDIPDLQRDGYDAVSGYNHPAVAGSHSTRAGYEAQTEGYRELWQAASEAEGSPYIPVLSAGWDSRPWHGESALVVPGRTPDRFAAHLADAKGFVDKHPVDGAKLLFIEAWNEWGEGSYIEPHRHYGFGYLDAIASCFGAEEEMSDHIRPEDVGLHTAEVRGVRWPTILPADPPSREVVIPAGVWNTPLGRIELKQDAKLDIPAGDFAEIIAERLRLSDEVPDHWRGGSTLSGSHPEGIASRIPGSIDASSVRMRLTAEGIDLQRGRDFFAEEEYGGLCRLAGGRIAEDAEVLVDYRHWLSRIDGIDVSADGAVLLRRGIPAKVCPLPPPPHGGFARLANIYRPYGCDAVESSHICDPVDPMYWGIPAVPTRVYGREGLARTTSKLESGRGLTVVALGDSVTGGGDASSAEKTFVRLFETGLRERYPSSDIRVINAGVGGTNSDFALQRLDTDVISHQPDLVIIEFVNDTGLPPKRIRDNYQEIFARCRESSECEFIVLTPHFVRPAWMGSFEAAAQAMRETALAHGAALADVSAAWRDMRTSGIPYESLLKNGINHPDDRGHKLYAAFLLACFQ